MINLRNLWRFRVHYPNNRGEEGLYLQPSDGLEIEGADRGEGAGSPLFGGCRGSRKAKDREPVRTRATWTKSGIAKDAQPSIRAVLLKNKEREEGAGNKENAVQNQELAGRPQVASPPTSEGNYEVDEPTLQSDTQQHTSPKEDTQPTLSGPPKNPGAPGMPHPDQDRPQTHGPMFTPVNQESTASLRAGKAEGSHTKGVDASDDPEEFFPRISEKSSRRSFFR